MRISDIIAYVNHDLDDAIRAGVIKRSEVPKEIIKAIGEAYSKRIDTMVRDVINASIASGLSNVGMSEEISVVVYKLRDFLFERVYEGEEIRREFNKAKGILNALYEYYLEHLCEVSGDITPEKKLDRHKMVCDFIAGMTDSFALMTYERLFLPQQWMVL